MNNTPGDDGGGTAGMSREEYHSALFANMVIQQTNLAMMMLGKAPHPETGQFVQDLDAARMFIDQLEMLEAKTKGNLGKQEEALLRQALPALHMAYVEAANASAEPETGRRETAHPASHDGPPPAAAAAPPSTPSPAGPPTPPPDESRKKFSKKY